MSEDYTPTWEGVFEDAESTGEAEYAEPWNPTEDTTDEEGRTVTVEEERNWGEERHPSILLTTEAGSEPYAAEFIEPFNIERVGCDCEGEFIISGETDEFPPDRDDFEIQIYGVRKGDTDRVSVEIVDADPLTLQVNSESGSLYRIWATGCLLCNGGADDE